MGHLELGARAGTTSNVSRSPCNPLADREQSAVSHSHSPIVRPALAIARPREPRRPSGIHVCRLRARRASVAPLSGGRWSSRTSERQPSNNRRPHGLQPPRRPKEHAAPSTDHSLLEHDCNPVVAGRDRVVGRVRNRGVDADDGRRVGRLSPPDGAGSRRRPSRPGPRLLRLEGRDAPRLGRLGSQSARALRPGDPLRLRRPLRPGRGARPGDGRAPGADPAAGDGARDRRPQERGRVGRDRPGRGHAHDHGRRARRHAGLLGPGHPQPRRTPGPFSGSQPDRRPPLRPHPPRHVPGRGPRPPRPRPPRQRGRDARRARGLEGGRHRSLARTPPRRHDGRPPSRRPGRRRARLRHRGRPRTLGAPRALANRRSSRSGDRHPLQALSRDRGRVPTTGGDLLSSPPGRRQGHPGEEGPPVRARAPRTLARRAGGDRLGPRAAGGRHRRRPGPADPSRPHPPGGAQGG